MRFKSANAAPIRSLALVCDDDFHACGFTHNTAVRRVSHIREVRDQAADADAADLFVVRQREMQRTLEVAPCHLRHQGQGDGDKTLHVAYAASDQAVAGLGGLPRIGVPLLAVNRDHVGVAGKDDAAIDVRTDGGKQIRFLSCVVESQARLDAVVAQIRDYPFDQRQIRFAARGIEAHEFPDQLEGHENVRGHRTCIGSDLRQRGGSVHVGLLRLKEGG